MSDDARTKIFEELKEALDRASNGKAKLARMSEEARIVEDLGLYSLDLLDLRSEVEDRWGVSVADEEMITLRTVGTVIDFIIERTPAAPK